MASRTEKIHGLVEEVYKNLGENFTPATRQLVNAGRTYMRTLTASNNAAKSFYEAVSKVGQSAGERYGLTKDIGSSLIDIADLHRDLHIQTSMMLKSFNLDYINIVDAMLEQDLKNVQGEYKKYQSGNRFHTEAYDKALAQLKKQRKKSNRSSTIGTGGILKNGILNGRNSATNNSTYSSIDNNLNTLQDVNQSRKFNPTDASNGNKESEMKHVWNLNESGKQLDDFRIQSLKMAYVNEKQCYSKILEKHCNRIKCMLSECQKIIVLFQHKIEGWAPLFNRNNFYHSPELDKIIADNLKMLDRNSVIYDVSPNYQPAAINGHSNTHSKMHGNGAAFYNGSGMPLVNGPPNYGYGYMAGNKGTLQVNHQNHPEYNFNPVQNGYYAQGRAHNANGYEPDTYDYLYSSTLSIMSGTGGAAQPMYKNPVEPTYIKNGPARATMATNEKIDTSGRNSSSSSGFISGESMGSMASNTPVGGGINNNSCANAAETTYEGRSISEVYDGRETYANPLVITRTPSQHTNATGQHYRPHSIHQSAHIYYDGYGLSPFINSKAPTLQNGKTLVKALYPYHKKVDDDNSLYDTNQLDLNEGDIIALTPGVLKNGWHFGDNLNSGKSGWFPLSFTEGIEGPPLLPPPPNSDFQPMYGPKFGAPPYGTNHYGMMQNGALKRTDSLTNDSAIATPKINHSRSEHDLLSARGNDICDVRMLQKQNSIHAINNNWHQNGFNQGGGHKQGLQAAHLHAHDTYTHVKNAKQQGGFIYETPSVVPHTKPLTYVHSIDEAQPLQTSYSTLANVHPNLQRGQTDGSRSSYQANEDLERHHKSLDKGDINEPRRKRDKSLENIQKQQHLLLMANAASEPRSPSSASTEYPSATAAKLIRTPPNEDHLAKARPRTPLETLLPKLLEVESETSAGTSSTLAMNSQLVDRELDKRANLFSELKDRLKKRGGDLTNPNALPGKQDMGYMTAGSNLDNVQKRNSLAYKSEGTILTPPVPPTPPPLPPPNKF